MKVTIDIDVSPDEARQFFGLPNVAPLQDKMLERMQQRMDSFSDPAYMAKLASQLVVGGVESMSAMQQAFGQMMGAAMGGASSAPKQKD
ncbi:MAG: DUF6489 family protein [Pseudomonadota bacterium]